MVRLQRYNTFLQRNIRFRYHWDSNLRGIDEPRQDIWNCCWHIYSRSHRVSCALLRLGQRFCGSGCDRTTICCRGMILALSFTPIHGPPGTVVTVTDAGWNPSYTTSKLHAVRKLYFYFDSSFNLWVMLNRSEDRIIANTLKLHAILALTLSLLPDLERGG